MLKIRKVIVVVYWRISVYKYEILGLIFSIINKNYGELLCVWVFLFCEIKYRKYYGLNIDNNIEWNNLLINEMKMNVFYLIF